MNPPSVLSHRVGDVLIGLSIIRWLSDPDGKRHNPIYAGIVHRLEHFLRHELHDRGNLVNGELFSRAHMRVRIDDFDLFAFNVDHDSPLEVFSYHPLRHPTKKLDRDGKDSCRNKPVIITSLVPSTPVLNSSYPRIFQDWAAVPSFPSVLRRYPLRSLCRPFLAPAPEATPGR